MTIGVMPGTSRAAPLGRDAVLVGGGSVVPTLAGTALPASRSRLPRKPATTDAAASEPLRMRKPRRDQFGIDEERVGDRGRPFARRATDVSVSRRLAQPSSHESDWMPANAPTAATIAAGAAAADGSPRAAMKPNTAKAPNPAAPIVNDRRAASPRSPPTPSDTTTMRVSRASLSLSPKRLTTRSFAPGGW